MTARRYHRGLVRENTALAEPPVPGVTVWSRPQEACDRPTGYRSGNPKAEAPLQCLAILEEIRPRQGLPLPLQPEAQTGVYCLRQQAVP